MSERANNESWERRLPLYSYLEPLWAGRKVLELGCGTGAGAEYLIAHGATRVVSLDSDQPLVERARARYRRPNLEYRAVAHLADLTKLGESFDVVIVAAADALLLRADVIAAWKRVLADGGRLVVAVGNADRTGPAGGAAAAGGVGYYQLTDALSPHFAHVQMFGQTPFLGVGMIEFDAPAEGLRVDTRLLEGEGEPASHYVAVASNAEALPLGYALVQVPFAPLEARLRASQDDRETATDGRRDLYERRLDEAERKARARLDEAEGRISELRRRLDDAIVQSESAMRIARAQGEEIEDLRARLRRTNEDRSELETELGKLRRALADADASVMALTRRTAEEMTAVAERLSVSLRAPEEIHAGKAYAAEMTSLRDHAEELRVRLAETESRAGAAERRLEETATAARDREHETSDLRARLRRAEDALERERLAVQTLQEQARIAGAEIEQLAERASALHDRDERIARLEGEKQDLAWRTAELEEKLRTAIARAVSAEATRGVGMGLGGPVLAPVPPPAPSAPPVPAPAYQPPAAVALAPVHEELVAVRASRDRAVEEFHRAAATHIDEVTRLQGSVNEQAALVAELEDSLRAAEGRATAAANDAATLRKNARELEEADRARRSRLAELEGKLLRLEHEKKAVAQAAAGNEELERKLQAAETERETLRAERDRLLGRVGELETAPAAGGNGHEPAAPGRSGELAEELAGIEAGLRAEMRTLASLEAALGAERTTAGHGAGEHRRDLGGDFAAAPANGGESSRLENTLANFRRRAQQLRNELDGYRWRVESLSASEVSILLDELGEGLSEFEA
jgi:SAM-dependent methyltransferase/predicted  nucleic acid-binding Zn-ribbon protein